MTFQELLAEVRASHSPVAVSRLDQMVASMVVNASEEGVDLRDPATRAGALFVLEGVTSIVARLDEWVDLAGVSTESVLEMAAFVPVSLAVAVEEIAENT